MKELENSHRKYLGLKEIDPHWIRIEICNEVIYHNGTSVLKEIRSEKGGYFECDLNEPLPEKLNNTTIGKFKSGSVYFSYYSPHIMIGNIKTQRTFIEDITDNLDEWLDAWIADSGDNDLEELKRFSEDTRCHQRYKEGDFFAFKLSRRKWGFGRIIYDIGRRRKTEEFISEKNYGLSNLMGHALIVQVYHFISPTPQISVDILKGRKMLPSQSIFDNRFLYGDYKVIGNAPIDESEIIPFESYGRSLNRNESFYYLQYGLVYRERKLPPPLVTKIYRNESIGFTLHMNEKLVQSCIETDSNMPYWSQHYYYVREDLRNPENAKDRRRIFRHFGIKP